MEKQLQVTDSFKLDFPTYPSRELNEMSTEETSGDEQEINELQETKGGETQVIIVKNAQISITIITTVTDSSSRDPRKTNKQNSDTEAERLQDYINPGV